MVIVVDREIDSLRFHDEMYKAFLFLETLVEQRQQIERRAASFSMLHVD
jgi:hypothetical protein